ncbi:MAG: phosphopantothenate/pantothenate synthetase [Thermoplasmatales archaeon]
MEIPKNHPRYESLVRRERLLDFYQKGIVTVSGLISHGRGEAFDYLIGEKTQIFGYQAELAAIDKIMRSKKPVISVNGNTAALAGKEIAEFAKRYNVTVEANIFYWSRERMEQLVRYLESLGVPALGLNQDALIPGLESNRGKCESKGIFSADTVLIPLEDGDRAEALKKMGKFTITIDLNPLSRTSRFGDITIVDDVQRAFTNLNNMKPDDYSGYSLTYDNSENTKIAIRFIAERLLNMKSWPEL